MHYLILLLFVLTFTACNNNTETTSTETNDTLVQNSNEKNDDSTPMLPGDKNGEKSDGGLTGSCYMQILQRDTIVLHIDSESENNISGKLSFDNYQKDGSTGTVKGKREGDVLQLVYSFQSEGTNSVMEVYFKEKNDGLVRGVGEIKIKGDTAYFVHPEQITYPSNGVMKKTDCLEVPAKYK
jgi:hypothetical protein